MHSFKKYGFIFSFLFLSSYGYSQFYKDMEYKVETAVTTSFGEYSPFWLSTNNFGLSSIDKNNGYLRAGVFRPNETEKKFSYGFGLDLAGAYNFTSNFIIQQAYLDLRYYAFELSVGSKERYSELKHPELSSGGMTFSQNARPIPQFRISLPEYWNVPGTKELFAIKGHVSYGMFTDNNWQKDFVAEGSKYTKNVLYHSKALFARIGNEEKFPLVFEGGLEMAAQFGGRSFNRGIETNMPNGIKDFFKVLIPTGGDESTPTAEQTNIYGNHLGSWNFSLSYKFSNWKIRGYYEHFFEDHSQMFGEYGWKDCLTGIELTMFPNPIINQLVYEYIGTKDQSGPIFHDQTPEIPDQISGNDYYYNHYIYTGWQHWGMGIGNPLLLSPIYNKDGLILFKSNRVKAHHIGLKGNPHTEWNYRVLLTYAKHWGTYFDPLEDIKRNLNSLVEITYTPSKLNQWNFSLSIGLDGGNIIGRNQGIKLKVYKTGLLSK